MEPKADIAVIGLAVMGQNLILNMNDHGFTVVAYNRTTSKVDEFLGNEAKDTKILGAHSLEEMVAKLKKPRVIDLVMILKDAKGKLMIIEAKNLEGEAGAAYRELAKHTDEWFSEGDIEALALSLPNTTSAGLLLFENIWAIKFKEALLEADAELIDMGRIPPESIAKAEKRPEITRRCLNMRGRGLMLVAGMKAGESRAQKQYQMQAQQQAAVEQARQEGAAQAQAAAPAAAPAQDTTAELQKLADPAS